MKCIITKRRRIDLLDKLRTGKGLSKKRKNIIGGNFNVVENDRYNQHDDDEDNDDDDDEQDDDEDDDVEEREEKANS